MCSSYCCAFVLSVAILSLVFPASPGGAYRERKGNRVKPLDNNNNSSNNSNSSNSRSSHSRSSGRNNNKTTTWTTKNPLHYLRTSSFSGESCAGPAPPLYLFAMSSGVSPSSFRAERSMPSSRQKRTTPIEHRFWHKILFYHFAFLPGRPLIAATCRTVLSWLSMTEKSAPCSSISLYKKKNFKQRF